MIPTQPQALVQSICNGIDDDCDLAIDEAVTETYRDADGDGLVHPTRRTLLGPSGFVSTPDDVTTPRLGALHRSAKHVMVWITTVTAAEQAGKPIL